MPAAAPKSRARRVGHTDLVTLKGDAVGGCARDRADGRDERPFNRRAAADQHGPGFIVAADGPV